MQFIIWHSLTLVRFWQSQEQKKDIFYVELRNANSTKMGEFLALWYCGILGEVVA